MHSYLCINNAQSISYATIVLSAFGSALGGFLGAILFFKYRERIEKRVKAPKLQREYFLGMATKKKEGELVQAELGLGSILNNNDILKSLGFKDSVFKFDYQKVLPPTVPDQYIFYGPYNEDLNQRGKYEVKFIITGTGFDEKASHEVKESVILFLDVLRWVVKGERNQSVPETLCKRYLKYKDFINPIGKKSFSLYIYSDGYGTWEYRALLPENIQDVAQVLSQNGAKFILYFEKIEIIYHPEISLPW